MTKLGTVKKNYKIKLPQPHSHFFSTIPLPTALPATKAAHFLNAHLASERRQFVLFPGAGDSCVPICGCLGQPLAGICRVGVSPCVAFTVHMQLSPALSSAKWGHCSALLGGRCACTSRPRLLLQPHRTLAKCTK